MSVDTMSRFATLLAVDPEQLKTYRESPETRATQVDALNPDFWPLTDNEKNLLLAGDFNLIFEYLDDEAGERGITDVPPPTT